MWHSIIESPNKGIFGDFNIFWGCVFEQLSPNLLSFKIPSISYDRRTPTPSVLSHRGEHTPSNVASIAEPNTNLFDCPTPVPWQTPNKTVPRNPIHHQWQHKIQTTNQRHNGPQGIIEYFDSFNTFNSKQKLQQALKSWSKFSLTLFSKGREKHRATLTNPRNNFYKPMIQLRET